MTKPIHKTKRFLFFTGGTDSVVLFTLLTKMLKSNPLDELVAIVVGSPFMRSGNAENIETAFGQLMANLVDQKIIDNKELHSRISLLHLNTHIFNEHTLEGQIQLHNSDIQNVSIKTAKPEDETFTKTLRSAVLQETTVLSVVPTITPYLGACTNKFYLGACGSDIATENIAKLKKLFNLQFEIALQVADHSDLENELLDAGFDPFGRTGGITINKDWIPTLHTPLAALKKSDVMLLLHQYQITNYQVDKPECFFEYAAMRSPQLSGLTKIYFEEEMRHDFPSNYPSIDDFMETQELRFSVGDKPVTISKKEINQKLQQEMLKTAMRAMR
ncbi:hypothetical protein [Vibrio barjaei]|uniref:hypothetical protein n=1 Tax=Vibrio barjaei TaxID=1676683 RepID=UPI0022852575|nr:hypothetical protein [Vibrio barjaei]MCY9870382.1 hypothetical protein [Vibrio barjaei]